MDQPPPAAGSGRAYELVTADEALELVREWSEWDAAIAADTVDLPECSAKWAAEDAALVRSVHSAALFEKQLDYMNAAREREGGGGDDQDGAGAPLETYYDAAARRRQEALLVAQELLNNSLEENLRTQKAQAEASAAIERMQQRMNAHLH